MKQLTAEMIGKVFKPRNSSLAIPPLTQSEKAMKDDSYMNKRRLIELGTAFLNLEIERAIDGERKPPSHSKNDVLTVSFLKQFYDSKLKDRQLTQI